MVPKESGFNQSVAPAHTRQLQCLGRSPAIIWGGFGMPEENIVGIVCGTSEVWGGST